MVRRYGDPVALVRELITDQFPGAEVEYGRTIDRRALSASRYVWVEATGGDLSPDRSSGGYPVTVVVYGQGTEDDVHRFALDVMDTVLSAQGNQTLTSHGHIRTVTVTTMPFRQDLQNIPHSCYRFSATYSVRIRPISVPL